jgi:hypothetical protein
MAAECWLCCPFGGVLSKHMSSQDSQGRKLLHMVSIVAHLPITAVEGHYQIFRKLLYQQQFPEDEQTQ